MPFLRLFVEATVSSVPQDRALAEAVRSLLWLLYRTARAGLSCCCLCAIPPLVPSLKPELRIYSSGDIPITSPPLLVLLLIPLQWGSTFNFSKSFHTHFLIWPLQQSCEAARARIIIPIWKMGEMKYNALKWQVLSDQTRSWSMAVAGPVLNHSHTPPGLQLSKRQGVILIGAMSISTLSNIFCKHGFSSALDP